MIETREVEFTVCGEGGQPKQVLADMPVHSMSKVAITLDFGDDHVIDEQGEVYCNGGPGLIIKTGIRIMRGSVFAFFFGTQFTFDNGQTSSPGAVCKYCGRVARILEVQHLS